MPCSIGGMYWPVVMDYYKKIFRVLLSDFIDKNTCEC